MTKGSDRIENRTFQNDETFVEFSKGISAKQRYSFRPELLITDYGNESKSEPNSRTCSFKDKSRTKSKTDIDDIRRNSLPLSTNLLSVSYTDLREPFHSPLRRVRSFKMAKGNRKGTEMKYSKQRSRSSNYIENNIKRERYPSDNSDDSAYACSCSSTCSIGYFRVLLLGSEGVGKSTLANSFMTSEYMSYRDNTNDDEDDKTLTVLIDDEESVLEFDEINNFMDDLSGCSVDAYVIVFSVHDNNSFECAKQHLNIIRNDIFSDRPIILVANKIDLVRTRQVSQDEAKSLADLFDCKYIETSATLNHKVDDLLLGLLKQIKLKLNPDILAEAAASMIAQDQKEKPNPERSPKNY